MSCYYTSKMQPLVFVSTTWEEHIVLRVALISKTKCKKFIKQMVKRGFSDQHVVGGSPAPSFKLLPDSLIHVGIAGKYKPRGDFEDLGQYILPVKKSGIWRDFVLIPANDCKTDVTDVMFRRDSNKGDFLHSVVLNIPLNRSKVENAVDSPGRRSVQIHMVDAETQAELHVAYSEATYMLEPPCDTSRRKSAVILRREVAKVSPSPNGSFSIRLDDVNEETDQENRHQLTRRENMHRDIGEDSGDNAGTIEVDVTAKDKNEIAYEKLLSKQRLLKLVQQLAPAEAFSLTLGLGVPDVRKKQEEHQEKNVVTVYYNLLVYWLETMMGNDKQEAFNKLVVELKDVRKDLADSLEHEFNDICKATVQA